MSSDVRTVCVVITARPSYARIKTALAAIEAHPHLRLQLVIAASALLDRYGSVIDVIRADGFEPDAEVFMVMEGGALTTSAKSTGVGIMELSTVFDHLKPDAVLSVADRYETISTAITGSFMNLPVIHVQGGEVTGSIDEKVRHAVTKLADLHLVANEEAAERVRRMGEDPSRVVVTGCPSIDLARSIVGREPPVDHPSLRKGVGAEVDPSAPYLIVMQHPVTYEWREAHDQMESTLRAVGEIGMQTYWFWPNVDSGSDGGSRAIRQHRERLGDRSIRWVKNLPPEDFLTLLAHARCIVGNSSVGIREAAFLGTPTVNIGTRQRGRARGPNVRDVNYDGGAIAAAIRDQIDYGPYPSSPTYGDGDAGRRIAEAIAAADLTCEKRIWY